MVERRVSDGRRIGQLLASELTGLAVGVLADVSVTNADPDAEPSETGTEAYRVTHDDTVVASVLLYPDHATVCLHDGRAWPAAVTRSDAGDGAADTLRVTSGADVKRAVDALRESLGAAQDGTAPREG